MLETAKKRVKFRFLELFLAKKSILAYISLKIVIQVGHNLLRHCDVIR